MSEERAPLVYDPELIDREIAHYLPLVKEGKSFSDIKAELTARGVEVHNIRMVVKELDKQLLTHKSKAGANSDVIIGFIVVGVILAISVLAFASGYIVVAGGALLLSLGALFRALNRARR